MTRLCRIWDGLTCLVKADGSLKGGPLFFRKKNRADSENGTGGACMSNIIWFLVGWFVTAILAWILWVRITIWYFANKAKSDETIRNNYTDILERVSAESRKDGRFVEWMRFLIFPCGITQRTMMIAKTIRKYQEEAQ